jgi:hypothetical protein
MISKIILISLKIYFQNLSVFGILPPKNYVFLYIFYSNYGRKLNTLTYRNTLQTSACTRS